MHNWFIFIILMFFGCTQDKQPDISFYYWKTHFDLNNAERETLYNNKVKRLYIRLFDVDWSDEKQTPIPIAPLIVKKLPPKNIRLVPVVYIKNSVFENISNHQLDDFAYKVHRFSLQILEKLNQIANEFQIDCDWTQHTQKKFFVFLKFFKKISNKHLSVTVRLHQIKYPQIMGIPPVDEGVLMYYNMGEINEKTRNSIYDRDIAIRYLPFMEDYPLYLNVALPIFSWGVQIREGKVTQLLNKFTKNRLENERNFHKIGRNLYRSKRTMFISGYYIQAGDIIKIEEISTDDLVEMASDLSHYLPHLPKMVIYYDLDEKNIQRFDSTIFQNIQKKFG